MADMKTESIRLVFNSANATSYLYIVDTNSAKPWGIKVIGGDGSNDNPFTFSTVYDWPNNCPQELIIGTDGTCSFAMPTNDVTIDYEPGARHDYRRER